MQERNDKAKHVSHRLPEQAPGFRRVTGVTDEFVRMLESWGVHPSLLRQYSSGMPNYICPWDMSSAAEVEGFMSKYPHFLIQRMIVIGLCGNGDLVAVLNDSGDVALVEMAGALFLRSI